MDSSIAEDKMDSSIAEDTVNKLAFKKAQFNLSRVMSHVKVRLENYDSFVHILY